MTTRTPTSQVSEAANEGIVAILAAAALFVLPVDWAQRTFTLNWNEASQIDWGTVILFGGGLVLGSLLSQTGLAEVVGDVDLGRDRRLERSSASRSWS